MIEATENNKDLTTKLITIKETQRIGYSKNIKKIVRS